MKRTKRNLAVGLILCVALLALLAVLTDPGEGSPAQSDLAGETPALAQMDTDDEMPPVLSVEATPRPTPPLVPRYSGVSMSEAERHELAGIVQLEAGNQCAGGQQAVVEVVLNRVISPEFPDTVHDVLHQGEDTQRPQFSTIGNLPLASPTDAQYAAIDAAMYGPSILPNDVVFFSRGKENERVWGKIQDHVFCYKYIWE